MKFNKRIDWTLQDLRVKLHLRSIINNYNSLTKIYHNYYKHKNKDFWNCTNHNLELNYNLINNLGNQIFDVADAIGFDNGYGDKSSLKIIIGNSMSQTMNPGDIAIITSKIPKIGDIVQVDKYLHRVVEIKEIEDKKFLITKGDNNEINDDMVNMKFCCGVVSKIIKKENEPELYNLLFGAMSNVKTTNQMP